MEQLHCHSLYHRLSRPVPFGYVHKTDKVHMIRVILVDDQITVRHGLRMRLMLEPDMLVVGEAGDGQEALHLALSLSPDVVLMDIEMPGMDGIAATEAMKAQAPQSATSRPASKRASRSR